MTIFLSLFFVNLSLLLLLKINYKLINQIYLTVFEGFKAMKT